MAVRSGCPSCFSRASSSALAASSWARTALSCSDISGFGAAGLASGAFASAGLASAGLASAGLASAGLASAGLVPGCCPAGASPWAQDAGGAAAGMPSISAARRASAAGRRGAPFGFRGRTGVRIIGYLSSGAPGARSGPGIGGPAVVGNRAGFLERSPPEGIPAGTPVRRRRARESKPEGRA
ncbi:hypothetical protein LGR69_06375 [Methylobacterium brachiatum]|nr:hypothetical protein [Methylobacterium brachiatum]